MAAPAPPLVQPPKPRTIVYIDGFNLYYGAVRATPALKWLDIEKFCRYLLPNDDIRLIRYFSALISGPTAQNQMTYLKALSTTPLVEVILGKFKRKSARCGVTTCTSNDRLYQTWEEKRTDVNIAICMLDDAYQDICDRLVLFSGDSDLVPAVTTVRTRFPKKKIIVYVPAQNPVRGAAVELRASAHKHRLLPLQLLAKSQFPNQLSDGAGGFIARPIAWV